MSEIDELRRQVATYKEDQRVSSNAYNFLHERFQALEAENEKLKLGLGHALETIETQANEYAAQLEKLNRKLIHLEARPR